MRGIVKMKSENRGLAENNSIGGKLDGEQLLLPFNTACHHELPAAGNRNGTSLNNDGSNGNYWSASLNEDNNGNNAWNLNFNNGNYNSNNNYNRNNGLTVRPVEIANAATSPSITPYRLTREQLLVDLFTAYKDARRHKRKTMKQVEFEMDMERKLVELRDELWNRRYVPGASVCFVINDPKKREIFAAEFRDRIVHHLYYNYTSPIFERTFIADSYSCRKGRGTHYGVRRLVSHIRSCSDNYKYKCYVLKCDIKGYFMNIDRDRLLRICDATLGKMSCHMSGRKGLRWIEVVDYDFVGYLGRVIILNDPVENCIIKGREDDWKDLPHSKSLFKTSKGCGLPIGNLTSQLFSNVYMNVFDQFVKRICRQRHYGRYVDDAYVVSREKWRLRELAGVFDRFLRSTLGLRLHPHKTMIKNAEYGIEFLGVYVKPFREYVRNGTKCRVMSAVKRIGGVYGKRLECSVNSYLGILAHYKSYSLRKMIFCRNGSLLSRGAFDISLTKFKIQ